MDEINNYLLQNPDEPLAQKIQATVARIEETFQKYRFEETCISFNGGKDCTVILYLIAAVIEKLFPDLEEQFQALYVKTRTPFPEVEEFINQCRVKYNLQMIKYTGRIKDNLALMKTDHPKIKAVFMGSRNTDPYCQHLSFFTPTDPGWPEYMRVGPIIDWSYDEVWTFLRRFSVDYCCLYDRGYTSLGGMENTHPNPVLRDANSESDGSSGYKPAYMLTDSSRERDGRH